MRDKTVIMRKNFLFLPCQKASWRCWRSSRFAGLMVSRMLVDIVCEASRLVNDGVLGFDLHVVMFLMR